ncbi:MAG TPA: glycosyltransferase family 4 protein, partial [Terriglobales bacterium]|nr:glycosyltransferase family 4 protein [Terriglobales bacterium]
MKSDRQIFHLLSFEGPDPYARAGGIATRVDGLARALAALGFETHLWFIGDPDLPASEHHGSLHLHRWCQWISRLSPAGVYVDEEGKRRDYAASLPPHLVSDYIVPAVARRARVTVVAEEWQTFHAVLHLDWLLRIEGLRQSADILWNANNVFGFDAIEWPRLKAAATVTTVSRYMRQRMWQHGVDALVVPNGLPPEAFRPVDRDAVARLRQQTRARVVLGKVARWDPDKRWLLAVDTVAELKRSGRRPLLIARGGLEAHGAEVLEHARTLALRVVERRQSGSGVAELVASTADLDDVDVLSLQAPLSADACRTLFRAADAVLVNSGHEPFGLVGLESMAVGGITCVGGTGEDYALAGWDALVLQSADPGELVRQYLRLESDPKQAAALRRRAAAAARRYSWDEVIRRNLLPYLGIAEP